MTTDTKPRPSVARARALPFARAGSGPAPSQKHLDAAAARVSAVLAQEETDE